MRPFSQDNDRVIAIHQPSYLPWMGYFHKIFSSDVFVFHDNVEYSKKTFFKRVFIKKPSSKFDKIYLSLPLKGHRDKAFIKDLVIDNSKNWRKKHLNLIKASYQKYPYFKQYYPQIEDMISSTTDTESFADTTISIVNNLLAILGNTTIIERSSSIDVAGKKHDYNMSIVKYFKGNIYLSGTDAKTYQKDVSTPSDIKIVYQDIFELIEKHPYETQGEFINGLSIVDALFSVGVEEVNRYLTDPIF
jgi:hypothetical protein